MTTALLLKIGAESSQLRGELSKANGMVNKFTGQMTALGGVIAGAFTASAVAGFVMEVSKLAAEAEGVRNAFNKLPNSVQLMNDLKAATAGTVSELDLMKRAVAFSNFNLSLAEMPKLLEFATKRAQQTGQSVDYLVDSIVTGLGRKSVMILDNLGLSANAISEEVKKTGDFMKGVGNIVDVELGKMGPLLETNVSKLDRLNASWVNYKLYLGEAANSTGILGTAVASLTSTLDVAGSTNLSFWEKLAHFVGGPGVQASVIAKEYAAQLKKQVEEQKKSEQVVREVDRAYAEFNKDINAYGKTISQHIYKNELLAEFQKRLNAEADKAASLIENEKNLTEQLNTKKADALLLTGANRAAINAEIKVIEEKIKALQAMGTAQEKADLLTSLQRKKFLAPIDVSKTPDTAGLMPNVDASLATASAALETFHAEVAPVAASLKGTFIDLSMETQNAFTGMAMTMGDSIGNMLSGIGGMEQIAAGVVGSLGAMAVQLGQTMIQFGFAGIALKKFVKSPAGAIAAGIALVALGKLLSNKAQGIAGGGGRGGSGGGGISSSPERLTRLEYGNRVEVSGEFELRNDRLVAAITNENRRQNRTLPSKRG